MAPPLARVPAATQITEEGAGEEASLLGSLAPAPPPPAALQCHFKPLTGEVCIGEAPPLPTAEGQQGENGACFHASMTTRTGGDLQHHLLSP